MSKYSIDNTTLTAIADAIREKSGTTDPILTEGMAAAIAAIEAGDVEIKSFTVADRSENFIVEILTSIPRVIIWFDADWNTAEDAEIDMGKSIFGAALIYNDEKIMQCIACYKSSNSTAKSYGASTIGTYTTSRFDKTYKAAFATDVLTAKKNTNNEICLVACVCGDTYGLRAGQTIDYGLIF